MADLTLAPPGPLPELRHGSPALHSTLERALARLVDHSTLLFAQLTCPTLLTGPVTAQASTDTARPSFSRTGPRQLYVRQLTLPRLGRVRGGMLVLASQDQQAVIHADGLPALIALIMDREIERQLAEAAGQAAVDLANLDAATGLGNRRAWMNTLNVECARAARTSHPLAVIVLDLDGLKVVNDTQGHAAGDQLIARTATCLTDARRATDVICRLGGDEFGIAAPDTDALQARQLAGRIRAVLHHQGVEVSIGWAVSSTVANQELHPEQLWQHADDLMYQDKRARR